MGTFPVASSLVLSLRPSWTERSSLLSWGFGPGVRVFLPTGLCTWGFLIPKPAFHVMLPSAANRGSAC